ncbi:Plasmid pRiA4b ORF-3-like protein [Dermatophilus congolensis]|uniref:Plasmid pRiA4b ORF-3-like protein n=1 Tax=Dermatophilus congolensis TaxID=1863 RepID=A0AA46BQE8_9MICO|nr:plasmid pRiA4b ORF-3 family protein [Dermatophilus congolensis]STD15368.1 Plasmid pRiA4b ORF-3-like protein [Dermatophilus congolensis]
MTKGKFQSFNGNVYQFPRGGRDGQANRLDTTNSSEQTSSSTELPEVVTANITAPTQDRLAWSVPRITRMTLHVQLENSYPSTWRRIEIDASIHLDQLHEVLCAAMGWDGTHQHQFTFPHAPDPQQATLIPLTELEQLTHTRTIQPPQQNSHRDNDEESHTQVADVLPASGAVLQYSYGLAHRQQHTITVETIQRGFPGQPRARLIDGNPDRFEKEKAARRVQNVDLLEQPPPTPMLECLDPAVTDIAGIVDSHGWQALRHLIGASRLDTSSLIHEYVLTAQTDVTDISHIWTVDSNPTELPTYLDEQTCALMVEPFAQLLRQCGGPHGWALGADTTHRGPSNTGLDAELLDAAVGLRLIHIVDDHAYIHPELPYLDTPRDLAEIIARRLPLGGSEHACAAGVLALLTAASGVVSPALLADPTAQDPYTHHAARIARLCLDVVHGLGWDPREGDLHDPTVAFWGAQTWSVIAILSGGNGIAGRMPEAFPGTFPASDLAESVSLLARSALRMW